MIGDHEDFAEGLPLHYYVARKTNVDIDTIKMLIEAYPQAMVQPMTCGVYTITCNCVQHKGRYQRSVTYHQVPY